MRYNIKGVRPEDESGMSVRRPSRRRGVQRHRIQWLTAAAVVAVSLPPLQRMAIAQDNWIAGSSNWNNPVNWSLGAVPDGGSTAKISDNDTLDRTISYDYEGPAVTLSSLTVTNTGGGTNTLLMADSNAVLAAGQEIVGQQGTAGFSVVSQSAGSNSVSGYMEIDAAYDLSGGTLTVPTGSYSVFLGAANKGVFNQSGGVLQCQNPSLGFELDLGAGQEGTYNLTAGTISNSLSFGSTVIGIYSPASLNLGTGDPTFVAGQDLVDGSSSTGAFTQQSGTTEAGGVYLGGDAGAYSVAFGSTMSISGGTFTVLNTNFQSGLNPGAATSITISGGSVQILNGNQATGGLTGETGFILGEAAGATSGLTLTGGVINDSGGQVFVGYSGTGVLTQTNGTLSATELAIGWNPGSVGAYAMSGGVLTVAGGQIEIGLSGSATFMQSGSAVISDTGPLSISQRSTYDMYGGALSVGTQKNAVELDCDGGTFLMSGGTATVSAVFNGGQFTVSGGSLTDFGGFTTDGVMNITGGSVEAGDSENEDRLSITDGGSLGVTGFTQTSKGTLTLGIQSLTGFNQLLADGAVSLAGSLALQFGSGYLPQLGDSFPIIVDSGGMVSGTFSSFSTNTTFSGGFFAVEYNPAGNPGGVDVEFVPEPGCGALLLAGALAALGRRNRKGQHEFKGSRV